MVTSDSVQTRSEMNGLVFFDTVAEAIRHAEIDDTVWKISFDASTGERIRLVREHGHTWVYDPIVLPTPPKPMGRKKKLTRGE
jgi:hypothetical protein